MDLQPHKKPLQISTEEKILPNLFNKNSFEWPVFTMAKNLLKFFSVISFPKILRLVL